MILLVPAVCTLNASDVGGDVEQQKKGNRSESNDTYDPRLLMPLAVGNKWVYQWESPASPGTEEVEKDQPIFCGLRVYTYGGSTMTALSYCRKARAHREIYTVIRQDGEHYFFVVASDPNVPAHEIRDGRYEESIENCWTLWDDQTGKKGNRGLTESIKRRWTYPSKQYFLEDEQDFPAEVPIDNRNVMQNPGVEYVYTNKEGLIIEGTKYRLADVVKVPAGTFAHCLEFVHTVPKQGERINRKARDEVTEGGLPKWAEFETHTFWAPEVGMIYEYQKRPDGMITYEMKLLKFGR